MAELPNTSFICFILFITMRLKFCKRVLLQRLHSQKITYFQGWRKCKAPYTFSVQLRDFTVWRHTWRKNWVNCAVLTGNSAGLRTVLSSRLSHRELRSPLRESHRFISLPADTTMASSQGTQFIQQMRIAWYIHFQIPLLTPHFTFSFLLFG